MGTTQIYILVKKLIYRYFYIQIHLKNVDLLIITKKDFINTFQI